MFRESPPTPTIVSSSLMNDVYLSFKFSQGIPSAQTELVSCICDLYMEGPHRDDYFGWAYDKTAVHALKGRLARPDHQDMLPSRHTTLLPNGEPITAYNVNGWFGEAVDLFAARIQVSLLKRGGPPQFIEAANYMLRRDFVYMRKGRPNCGPEHDPYQSLVREYVLGNRAVSSTAFSSMFQSMRQLMATDPDAHPVLPLLAEAWEARHPDESFYP